MSGFLQNHRKIWLLVKAVAIVVVLTTTILVLFNYFNNSLAIKISLTLITVLLAMVDIYNNYQKSEKHLFESKRSLMILLAIFWFLFTVWDNINQENRELKQAQRADSLSTVVANRTDEIIADINTSLGELEKSGKDIDKIDSILLGVKDKLEGQVDLLNDAVGKSKELTELENNKLRLQTPDVKVLSGNIKFSDIPKDSTKLGVKLSFINYKERTAKNLRYLSCFIVYKSDFSKRNIFLNKVQGWHGNIDLSGGGTTSYNIENFFGIPREEFKNDYGFAILVLRVQYKDEYDFAQYDKNLFFTCRYAMYDELKFSESYEREKKFAKSYLKELKISDILID